jgi:hypothetical protein
MQLFDTPAPNIIRDQGFSTTVVGGSGFVCVGKSKRTWLTVERFTVCREKHQLQVPRCKL